MQSDEKTNKIKQNGKYRKPDNRFKKYFREVMTNSDQQRWTNPSLKQKKKQENKTKQKTNIVYNMQVASLI